MLGERLGERHAVRVSTLAQLVLVCHRACRRTGAEQRAPEASALLVGPVHEPHRDGRLALLGQPSQHLDAGHDVETAVEPAAVRHRVDVAADEQRALGSAAQREPLVARLVDLLLDGHGGELPAQPLARPLPRLRPRDALGAVLVSGQLLELAQLVDGARWLERHVLDPKTWYAVPWRRRTVFPHRDAAGRPRRHLGRLRGVPLALAGRPAGRGRSRSTTARCRTSTTSSASCSSRHDATARCLGGVLLDAALFTAKEAFVGFAIGATVGFSARRAARPTSPCSRGG